MEKAENSLIKIIDVKIRGRNTAHPALYEIVFKLNKSTDPDWVRLFENPTTQNLNIQLPRVEAGNQEIVWLACEEDIRNNQHWIEKYVEDANQRFLPITRTRLINQENDRGKAINDAKIQQELETILKDNLKTNGSNK